MTEAAEKTSPESQPRHSAPPLEFEFDARHKSIVRAVFALEAKRLKRFFGRKPKVSLHQLESTLNESAGETELRKLIPQFVSYYLRSADYGHRFFEALGRLLLEAAARERTDAERQWFLLTQSLETLQLAVQKSPKALNVPAQSILVSIYKVMGPAHRERHLVEREVFKEMMHMLNVKKDPNDLASREKIIKLYLGVRNYYEALVHTAEYEKVMQAKSRSLYRRKQGEIAFRKAGIFQAMVDYYHQLAADRSRDDVGKFRELARLNSFITRFNRDNKRVKIVPLKSLDIFSLNRTIQSMVAIANNFYAEAGAAELFPSRHRAFTFMARNNWQFENPKGAQHNLAEGVRLLELSALPEAQKTGDLLNLLDFQHRIYVDLGQQRKADEVSRTMAGLRKGKQSQGAA